MSQQFQFVINSIDDHENKLEIYYITVILPEFKRISNGITINDYTMDLNTKRILVSLTNKVYLEILNLVSKYGLYKMKLQTTLSNNIPFIETTSNNLHVVTDDDEVTVVVDTDYYFITNITKWVG
jgi:hypothetical protein